MVVTYNDGTGSGRTAASDRTNRVDQEGQLTLSPSQPVVGVAVTAALADPDGMLADHAWKLERSSRAGTPDWKEITGATSATFSPTAADDGGKILRVTVTYDDPIGTGWVAIGPSTLLVDRPGVLSLSTTEPVAGESVTGALMDDDGEILNEMWQWEVSPDQDTKVWEAVSGATMASYTPLSRDAGKLLRAVVTYDDATGRGREAASDATAALDQRGTITLSSEEPAVGGEVWQWESEPISCFKLAHKVSIRLNNIRIVL